MSLLPSDLEADVTFMYSVLKPVEWIFFSDNISSATNPVTFTTDIVVCAAVCNPFAAIAEPVRTVEFAMYNCPPTAFTLSFSNTAVDSVPLIVIFWNSAVPLSIADILQPERPDTKFAVSISPSFLNIRFDPEIKLSPSVQPPIVPEVAFMRPAGVTLNGAVANVACPN